MLRQSVQLAWQLAFRGGPACTLPQQLLAPTLLPAFLTSSTSASCSSCQAPSGQQHRAWSSARGESQQQEASTSGHLQLQEQPLVVPFPKLSHTMTKGRLAKWFKKPGERVNMYDVLFEVETEELTEEVFRVGDFAGTVKLLVESQEEGWLAKVMVPAKGQELQVGVPIGVVVESEEDVGAVAQAYQPPTTDVYDEAQPEVKVLTWQSYLKTGERQVKCMG